MPYSDPKINVLEGGWYVVMHDGTVYTEPEMAWSQIPNKINIKLVGLKRMNKHYELENKETYCPPGETHMRELTINDGSGNAVTKQTLVGWFIGHYEKDAKVLLRVDAITGKVAYERIPYGQPTDQNSTP
jgi:hypothetical protein